MCVCVWQGSVKVTIASEFTQMLFLLIKGPGKRIWEAIKKDLKAYRRYKYIK